MNTRILELQKSIMNHGLLLTDEIAKTVSGEQESHLRQCFEYNEYGEAIIFIDYLCAEEGLALGPDAQRHYDEITKNMAEVAEIYERHTDT